jgi:hypothetical protein
MMEDLKKIENSWCEINNFSAFSKKLHTTTNLKQKKLKELSMPLASTTTNGW